MKGLRGVYKAGCLLKSKKLLFDAGLYSFIISVIQNSLTCLSKVTELMIQRKAKINPILILTLLFSAVLFLHPCISAAQQEQGTQAEAEQLLRDGKAEKALPVLHSLYQDAPFDKTVYSDYLNALIQTKGFDQADSVVRYMMQIRRGDPSMFIDLGRVATAAGHKRKARKFYEEAIQDLPPDEFQIKDLANAFSDAGLTDYAIRVYLKAREMNHNPYLFATELALLYNQEGDYQGAIQATLDNAMAQVDIMNDVKSALLQVISKEKNGLKEIQKSLNSRLKQDPNNPVWQELLSWTYAQAGNYSGALKNLINLDRAFNEQGKRLLPFAKTAVDAEKYDLAQQAYNYILQKGKDQPYYEMAAKGELACGLKRLENKYPPSKEEVQELLAQYKIFFNNFPQYKMSDFWRHYAMVEASYNNRPDSAIALLKQVVNDDNTMTQFQGWCKLDMGDDYLLLGKVWDATLLYSQVNKAFEQDELGELARFKNAKWAFYTGDFKLAQEQLSVLKASTSKLISNDAIYLSVLITENTPTDSNMVPLKRFASADLLLFKHQTAAADSLLDSISKAWPQSPLQDDIAMLRGKTAAAAGNWQVAIKYYKIVLNQYGQDVLGDDAAWQLAELYRKKLKDKTEAMHYYKMLILQYPGSTFVQEARKKYQELNSENGLPET